MRRCRKVGVNARVERDVAGRARQWQDRRSGRHGRADRLQHRADGTKVAGQAWVVLCRIGKEMRRSGGWLDGPLHDKRGEPGSSPAVHMQVAERQRELDRQREKRQA